jgi:hypothetical protein
MVQLWPGIPPEVLCDMYLNSCLNEGLNLLIRHHMAKGHRIDGWIGYADIPVDKSLIIKRISELRGEMEKRGKTWSYAILSSDKEVVESYERHFDFLKDTARTGYDRNIGGNPAKLAAKCLACRYRETRCKGKETCVERLKAKGMI